MKPKSVIIVTGCSGSGKSTALSTFEDAGFYCVDNMPIQLIHEFLKQSGENPQSAGWAFGMDLRDSQFLQGYQELLQSLTDSGFDIYVIFLDTEEQVLLQRYSQTRRRHPLDEGGSLVTAIRKEKKLLRRLHSEAHHVVDTTHFSVHELKFAMLGIAQKHTAISGMAVNVVSFGFKHGTVPDADMIVDVRFLANPYFVPELKPKSGEDEEIKTFVFNDPETGKFLAKYLDLLDYLIPLYEKEGKAYFTIAIGCTGGRHRSVVIAQKVHDHIQQRQIMASLIHRDIGIT